MGCCDAPGLLPFDDAIKQLLQATRPITQTETINLPDSLDRILATSLSAPLNVPGYDNSAMDGYALKANDLERGKQEHQQLTLIGKSFAGQPFEGELGSGQCVRIMTGALIPKGADCVVMQEDCVARHDEVKIASSTIPKVGAHIRRAGEDIAIGDTVLRAGKRIGPADLGLLASLGLAQIEVFRPLRVALLSTGDELRLPGQTLPVGCIYDSNRFVVAAMLKRLGCEVLDLGIIADNLEALHRAFDKASSSCDVVITSGGVSVGEADYTRDVLEQLGQVDFWKVAIKPGKPFAFGHLNEAVFFGLPGNPVSATVTFHQLALPAIRKMAGETQIITQPGTEAKNQHPLKKRPGRTDFQRGLLTQQSDGSRQVQDSGSQGSGMLSSMSRSNCYIKLPADSGNVEAGEKVEVIPYDRWIA